VASHPLSRSSAIRRRAVTSASPLRRPVAAGAMISCDDLDIPADSLLWRLRAEQDAMFPAG
jgi:predicted homoserine dehydrogenase-like protein